MTIPTINRKLANDIEMGEQALNCSSKYIVAPEKSLTLLYYKTFNEYIEEDAEEGKGFGTWIKWRNLLVEEKDASMMEVAAESFMSINWEI